MRLHPLLLLALLAAAPAPAPSATTAPSQQPDRPPMVPAKDALIAYHLAPGAGEAINVRVTLRAGGGDLRVDLPDTSYVLATPPTQTVIMVVPLQGTAVDLPWAEGPQSLFLLDDRAKYIRRGEATVAGQRCNQWDVTLGNARSTVCVTNDGILLRNQSQDPQGRRNLVEALAVRFQSVPGQDFTVPPGFERIGTPPILGPRARARASPGPRAMRTALFLLLLGIQPAAAQPTPPQPPRTQPTRDVIVTYRVEGQALSLIPGGIQGPVRLSWDAANQRLRAEADGRSQVALIDLRNRTGQAIDTTLRLVLPLPVRPQDLQPLTLDNARLTPRGKETIAGLACNAYQVETGRVPGSVCLTPDGVALRGQGEFDGKPGTFTALSVAYGKLPPTLFTVPQGYMALSTPGGGGIGGGLAGKLGNLGDLRSLGASLLGRGSK